MGTVRISLHEPVKDEVRGIAAALRPSVEVDDATWSVFVDALVDSALAGAQAGVEALLEVMAEEGEDVDVELDLLPPL